LKSFLFLSFPSSVYLHFSPYWLHIEGFALDLMMCEHNHQRPRTRDPEETDYNIVNNNENAGRSVAGRELHLVTRRP
jgi:hypothetical protein